LAGGSTLEIFGTVALPAPKFFWRDWRKKAPSHFGLGRGEKINQSNA
jgi:hypothetical protein